MKYRIYRNKRPGRLIFETINKISRPIKSHRFHVLPPLKKSPIKSHRFHVLPPLKNHFSEPIGFVYSPPLKKSPIKPHRFCVLPPLKNHLSKPSVLCTPPFEKPLFLVGVDNLRKKDQLGTLIKKIVKKFFFKPARSDLLPPAMTTTQSFSTIIFMAWKKDFVILVFL